LRLAVVSKYAPTVEGITEYGRHVVQALATRSDVEQITVIANQAGAVPREQRSRVHVRRVWRVGDASLGISILREIVMLKPDAIWYNIGLAMFGETAWAASGFLLPALTRRLGYRSVVTLHEHRLDQLAELGVPDGIVRRTGLRAAVGLLLLSDVVCVTTRQHRRDLERFRLPGQARIVHVPLCGYDEPGLEPGQEPTTALMLTSHAPHKGLPTLVEAFRQVRLRLPAARLVVAGIDHPRFPGYLQNVRRQYRSEPGIEWMGPVAADHLRATLSRATVTVAPYEVATGSSATIHQAVSVGRPVVATDLPELRSMAEEEDLWIEFFPRGSSQRLADRLISLLSDPRRCQAIARHNLASAQRNSLASTVEQYARLLQGRADARSPIVVSGWPSGALSR
jgi:glycosyltransferase involved in cell wall biosynthesis